MHWYYFTRSGNDLRIQLHGGRIPPRPADANPDNGDPLTPWYTDQDHLDDEHVHVRASSRVAAEAKARGLITPLNARVNLG
jgi:hypothetical protein